MSPHGDIIKVARQVRCGGNVAVRDAFPELSSRLLGLGGLVSAQVIGSIDSNSSRTLQILIEQGLDFRLHEMRRLLVGYP